MAAILFNSRSIYLQRTDLSVFFFCTKAKLPRAVMDFPNSWQKQTLTEFLTEPLRKHILKIFTALQTLYGFRNDRLTLFMRVICF